MSRPKPTRPLAALKTGKSMVNLIATSQAILAGMRGNAWFPSPMPSLATFGAQVGDLEAAQTVVRARTIGAAEMRDSKARVVQTSQSLLRVYVQSIADEHPPDDALAIIRSAGMSVNDARKFAKPAFAAYPGPASGSVRLIARAVARRASYVWQMSADQHVWADLAQTIVARTVVHGLTVGTTVYFRFRALTSAGMGDWSAVVEIVVR